MSVLNNLSVQGTTNIAGAQLSLIHPNQCNMSYNNTSKELKVAIDQTDEFFMGGNGNITTVAAIRGGTLVQSNSNPATTTSYSTTTTINLPANAAITYLTPNLSQSLRGVNLWNGSAYVITVTGLYLLTADWRYVNSQTDSTFNYTLWSTVFYNQTTTTEVIRQFGTKMHAVVQLTAGNNYVFGIQNSTTTAQTLRTVNTLNTFQVVLLA